VEDELLKPDGIDALLRCFVDAKNNSFENLLDPFLKLIRLSTGVAAALGAKPALIRRIIDRLGTSAKAVVRLNLLRVLRAVCDAHPNRAVLVERYGLYDVVRRLSKEDGAVLVRELAREIVPALRPALKPSSQPRRASVLSLAARSGSPPASRPRSPPPPPVPGIGGVASSPPKPVLIPKRLRRAASDNAQARSISPPSIRSPLAVRPPAMRHSKSRTNVNDRSSHQLDSPTEGR
jgi:hypothetical protein